MKDELISRINENKRINQFTFPTKMMLELTNTCNHSCLFCSHRKSKRKNQMMDYDFAIRMLDEAYYLGVREVALFMMGESFLYPRLTEIVTYAKNKGYEYIYLTTNGAKAEPDILQSVIEAGVDSIKFSINAIDKESYYLIHGKNDFDKVIENLRWLYSYKKDNSLPIHIYISSIITKYNNDINLISSVLGKYCDELVTYDVVNQDGMVPEIDTFLKGEIDEYMLDLSSTAPCAMVFNRYHITVEGYLSACCQDTNNYLAYADLHEQSLSEAWNNSIITEFRERHLSGNLRGSICNSCIYGENKDLVPLVRKYASLVTQEEIFCDKEIRERIKRHSTINKIE